MKKKRTMQKSLFFIIVTVAILAMMTSVFAFSAFADDVAKTGTIVDGDKTYTWTFDGTNKLTLTVTNAQWGENVNGLVSADADYQAAKAVYGESVTELEVIGCGKMRGAVSLLGCPNIETIILRPQSQVRWDNTTKMFGGLKKLKTIRTYSNDGNSADDVDYIDLSYVFTIGNDDGQINYTFENCTSIEKVVLPTKFQFFGKGNGTSESEKLKYIPTGFFSGCTSLSDISIPSWVTEIKDNAFKGCTALTEITVPASVTTISATAFAESGLADLYFEGTDISVINGKIDKSVRIHTANTDVAEKLTAAGYTVIDPLADYTETHEFSYESRTYTWTFDGNTKTLSIVCTAGKNYGEKMVEGLLKEADFTAFAESYGEYVKTLSFDGYDKLRGNINKITSYCPNIRKIILNSTSLDIGSGSFSGFEKLEVLVLRGHDKNNDSYIDYSSIGQCAYVPDQFTNMFKGCKSVKTVVFGSESFKFGSGSRYTSIGAGMFDGCESLDDVVLPAWVTGLDALSFANCKSLKTITIASDTLTVDATAFSGTSLEKIVYTGADADVIKNNFGTDIAIYTDNETVAAALKAAGYTVGSAVDIVYESHDYVYDGKNYNWTFDGSTRTLTITCTAGVAWSEPYIWGLILNESFRTFAENFGDFVEILSIKADKPENSKINDGISDINTYCPNIRKVETEVVRFQGNVAIFAGMEKLEAVSFLTSEDLCSYVDLANAGTLANSEDALYGMFAGCTSLKKVVLGSAVKIKDGEKLYIIPSSMFAGCTSLRNITIPEQTTTIKSTAFKGTALRDITIPASVTSINTSAFEGCTSLKSVFIESETTNLIIDFDAFCGCSDITFFCKNAEVAEYIGEMLSESGATDARAVSLDGGMSIEGLAVRVSGYNGLRTHFKFDQTKTNEGFTLVEYGTLCASSDKFDCYEETIDSLIAAGDVADSGIVKVKVWDGEDYCDRVDYSDLSGVKFTVTVVKFTEQLYDRTIKMVGYEIWQDESGEKYAIFTKYDNRDYEDISLLGVTLGFLSGCDAEGEPNSKYLTNNARNPIYATLAGSEHIDLTTSNASVKGMLFDHPINSFAKTAVYTTASSTKEEFTSLGLTKAQRLVVANYIYGENTEYKLPELNKLWSEYMIDKVESVPEGRSFIYITDTHSGNSYYSTTLIDYAKKALGINTVIFGGDPFNVSDTREGALDQLKTYSEGQFYGTFGSNALYTVGNHDSNYPKIQILGNTSSYNKEEYLISDTDLFDATVGHQTGIVFDKNAIAAAEDLTYSDNALYTAEEMKTQMEAAMKMHYYYDDAENKIRYIILDTGDNGLSQTMTLGGATYFYMLYTQLGWLSEVLEDVANNHPEYDVVVSGHEFSWAYKGSTETNIETLVHRILCDYRSGASSTLTFSANGNENMAKLCASSKNATNSGANVTLKYDFTARKSASSQGTIFTVGGHWHLDASLLHVVDGNGTNKIIDLSVAGNETTDLSKGVLRLQTMADNVSGVSDSDKTSLGITRERNTLTEYCFDIITITDDGRIVCTRVGDGANGGEGRSFDYNG